MRTNGSMPRTPCQRHHASAPWEKSGLASLESPVSPDHAAPQRAPRMRQIFRPPPCTSQNKACASGGVFSGVALGVRTGVWRGQPGAGRSPKQTTTLSSRSDRRAILFAVDASAILRRGEMGWPPCTHVAQIVGSICWKFSNGFFFWARDSLQSLRCAQRDSGG